MLHNNNELLMRTIEETLSANGSSISINPDNNNLSELLLGLLNSSKTTSSKAPKLQEEERRRQMAKNREYARKCVQKKKDQRKEANVRRRKLLEEIEHMKESSASKEASANFSVELLILNDKDERLKEIREEYEDRKKAAIEECEKKTNEDETVNVNYSRLEDAKDEFQKASDDLKEKNGVIGTLGSRKIRAKQHMEWRTHLYYISVHEHDLHREKQLAKLADDYVASTVPLAAPLVRTIPKQLLEELISRNWTSQLEQLIRFVDDNPRFLIDSGVK